MILISHRGNIDGKNICDENSIPYVEKALKFGFDVEIDVWFMENNFFLGHDEPRHLVKLDFLKNNKFWCHAKNLKALEIMLENDIHCFWHQNDDFTLTSKNIIWTYPNKKLTKNSVCVLPEKSTIKKFDCMGICSDFLVNYIEQ